MRSFCTAKAPHIFSANNSSSFSIHVICLKFKRSLTNDFVSVEQLGPDHDGPMVLIRQLGPDRDVMAPLF